MFGGGDPHHNSQNPRNISRLSSPTNTLWLCLPSSFQSIWYNSKILVIKTFTQDHMFHICFMSELVDVISLG